MRHLLIALLLGGCAGNVPTEQVRGPLNLVADHMNEAADGAAVFADVIAVECVQPEPQWCSHARTGYTKMRGGYEKARAAVIVAQSAVDVIEASQ